MHVRLASEAVARGISLTAFRRGLLGLAMVAMAAGAGCGETAAPVRVSWSLDPAPPVTGVETTARLTVQDGQGRPVRGARLRVEGHMSHPGMTPIVVPATEREDGRYEARMQFSMAGDWMLVVTGDLGNGTRITEQVEVRGVRSAR